MRSSTWTGSPIDVHNIQITVQNLKNGSRSMRPVTDSCALEMVRVYSMK